MRLGRNPCHCQHDQCNGWAAWTFRRMIWKLCEQKFQRWGEQITFQPQFAWCLHNFAKLTHNTYSQFYLTWSLHDSCMQDTHAFNISTVTVHTQQFWIHLHFTLLLFSFPSILAAWLAEFSGTILWQQVCSGSQPCKLCTFCLKNKPLYISFMLFNFFSIYCHWSWKSCHFGLSHVNCTFPIPHSSSKFHPKVVVVSVVGALHCQM